MNFCSKCGCELIEKECINFGIHNGTAPFCNKCGEFRFPMFNCAVSCVIFNPDYTKLLLIKQYGRDSNILIAGYVIKFEDLEAALKREIMEKAGLKVRSFEFNTSSYFEKSNSLICNFIIQADSENFHIKKSVDFAKWYTIEEAKKEILKGGLAEMFMLEAIEKKAKTDINSNNKCRADIRKTIIECVEKFPSTYGRSGIAKILKGSRGIKDNNFNLFAINSEFFGKLNSCSINNITSEIDKLIALKVLNQENTGNLPRPVLSINNKRELNLKNERIKPVKENDDTNLKKILKLVKSGENIFITGHAGTGKSYILNKLKEKLGKKLTITSTTGIAAVNVKGQTLHSFAGVGICNRPINAAVENILKKTSTRNQILQCKILAVDEISMLNMSTFEYVDEVLKIVRNDKRPFGGIQVILIGDFFQLPPVDNENNERKNYCFNSPVWQDMNLKTVFLTKNYRQNEENLIEALSNMRINSLTEENIKLLKTRECKEDESLSDILHIFATNNEADGYNQKKFREIKSKEYILNAYDGLYKGNALHKNPANKKEEMILQRVDATCVAEKTISLKIGVRVMLLTNLDFEKGLINGSTGSVLEIEDEYIKIRFDNDVIYNVVKHDFEFYHKDTLIAVRKQFPIRLAYGITIHKSQGMSLDKLVVDCSKIFEKGQAYVAISRIKTLNGLYLYNFDPKRVMVDSDVAEFYKNLKVEAPL